MQEAEFDSLLSTCRIQLANGEREKIKKDIEEVIRYFDSLDSMDCDGFGEAYHPIQIPEKTRDDEVIKCSKSDSYLKGIKTYRFYVVGPKI